MNFREGTRRLGIVLGVLGGAVGAFAGYPSARDLWNARAASNEFESLMTSPTMMKVAKAAKEYDPWEKYKSKFPPGMKPLDKPRGDMALPPGAKLVEPPPGYTLDNPNVQPYTLTYADGAIL